MNNALMFSKASDEWSTPQDFWDVLNAEFQFTVDAAARLDNTKCLTWLGPDGAFPDALAGDVVWGAGARIWLNPPYSKCREFIEKAADQARRFRSTVVCLVPSRTDTRWFHFHVWDRDKHRPRPGVEVRFVKGRLTFGGAPAGAPFPSVVIVFRPDRALYQEPR